MKNRSELIASIAASNEESLARRKQIVVGDFSESAKAVARKKSAASGENAHLQNEYKTYAWRLTKPVVRYLKMRNDPWFVGPKLRLHRTAGSMRRAIEADTRRRRRFSAPSAKVA